MGKLLIVTSSYPSLDEKGQGHAGVFVRDFARATAERGHGVRVITQRQQAPPEQDDGLEVLVYPWSGAGHAAVDLNFSRPRDLKHIWSLVQRGIVAVREACRSDPPDRCLCLWAVPAGYLAYKGLPSSTPYDVWCLGSDIWKYGRRFPTNRVLKKVLAGADRLFADGQALAREVRQLGGRDCGYLPSSRLLPEQSRVVARLAPDRANLVYIGRFHPNKGADLLPEAIRTLKDAGVEVHLHMFGGGPSLGQVMGERSRLEMEDCISVHGFADLDTTVAFLRASDLLVIPSRIESIPVIFSDGVKCGIPMVATDVGDQGTLVRRYGVGVVVPPDSPSALAEGIRKALETDRSRFLQATQRAAAAFDIRSAAKTYLEGVGLERGTVRDSSLGGA